mgnify:FL=1
MEFSSFRYLPLSDFFLFGVSFECYPFRFLPLDFVRLDASLLESILPGVSLLVVMLPTVFFWMSFSLERSLWILSFRCFPFGGFVLPCTYILSQHFIFARWDTPQRNALFFQQNINGNFPLCYATIDMLGAFQSAPNKNVPTERAAIIIGRS